METNAISIFFSKPFCLVVYVRMWFELFGRMFSRNAFGTQHTCVYDIVGAVAGNTNSKFLSCWTGAPRARPESTIRDYNDTIESRIETSKFHVCHHSRAPGKWRELCLLPERNDYNRQDKKHHGNDDHDDDEILALCHCSSTSTCQ
jgi:hypothetical protein